MTSKFITKWLTLTAIFFCVAVFTNSCGEKDQLKENILGKWMYIAKDNDHITTVSTYEFLSDNTCIETYYYSYGYDVGSTVYKDSYTTFDGKMVSKCPGFEQKGEVEPDKITLTWEVGGTPVVSGDIFTITLTRYTEDDLKRALEEVKRKQGQ